MRKCKKCKWFIHSCNTESQRGRCAHPERKDKVLVHYFGSLKETDYCTLFELVDDLEKTERDNV